MHSSPSATYCLSLCELPARCLAPDEGRSLLARRERPARVYLGSAFCPQLVQALGVRDVEALAQRCAAEGIPLTLVLPIAAESQLDALNTHADALVTAAQGVIDEVTVNDFGAFMHWGARIDAGLSCGLNLGRLFNKDTRDPRDADYPHLPHTPALLERDWRGRSNLDRLLATWPVRCIEFDPTHALLDLSDVPHGVQSAVYGPLCYMSTGRICEYAGIGRDTGEKFRPDAPCRLQCFDAAIRYTGASGVEFLKLGRSVYYDPGAVEVVGVPAYRALHSPLAEVLG